MNIVVMQERHLAALAEIERACFHAPWSENMLREELGKPVGSDAGNDKTTFITLYGLQGAHEEAERHNAAALAALDALGPGADFLRLMAAELLERKK